MSFIDAALQKTNYILIGMIGDRTIIFIVAFDSRRWPCRRACPCAGQLQQHPVESAISNKLGAGFDVATGM